MLDEIREQILFIESEPDKQKRLIELLKIKKQLYKLIRDSIQDKKKYNECKKAILMINFSDN